MVFVQTIEVQAADETSLRDHVAGWHADQAGSAPGYQGGRVLADADNPGRFLIEVDFSSRQEADRNSDRSETAAWASRLRELVSGEPRYANYRVVWTTTEGK
jgi:quinol monooxygenase YgiN